MAFVEQPITRSELREELENHFKLYENQLQHYATKEDLAKLETRLTRWMVGILIGSSIAATSIAVLVQSLVS